MDSGFPPLLEGARTRLRAYQRTDLTAAVQFLNQHEVRSLLEPGIPFPLRMEDEEQWYQSFSAISDGVYHFAIERIDTGEYIGGCGINKVSQKSRVATVGIFLGTVHQNQGFGSEAMQLLVDFCFLEMNLNKVKLKVYAFNQRAIHCYQRLGFQTEGVQRQEIFRNGSYHDEWLMALLRPEWESQRGKSR